MRLLALSLSVALAGVSVAALAMERRRPLRIAGEAAVPHDLRNLAVAALSAATITVLERPVVDPLSRLVERRRWGLTQHLPGPSWLRDAAAMVLMDYSLYAWHVLTHRAPALWRFHQVHHADLDLSASTALRFHFGEMAASVPWRLAQVLVIGTGPRALQTWRRLLFASIVFHHSNWRLPQAVERRLAWLIATPRLHGIHHAADRAWSDSNWTSGLTLWDRLHGTFRDEPRQPDAIGVAELRRPEQVRFRRLLSLPLSPAA